MFIRSLLSEKINPNIRPPLARLHHSGIHVQVAVLVLGGADHEGDLAHGGVDLLVVGVSVQVAGALEHHTVSVIVNKQKPSRLLRCYALQQRDDAAIWSRMRLVGDDLPGDSTRPPGLTPSLYAFGSMNC